MTSSTLPVDEEHCLSTILDRVRQSTQVDVSHYKGSTFRRQLDRRVLELGLSGLPAYVDLIEREPAELQRLQQSLLISVTRFFRDPEVFARLGEVLKAQVADKPDGQGLRLWVPGCATGEEAYTVAILVAEALGERLSRCPVRLFATDIDAQAIRQARQGLYPASALADVPEELAQRYFSCDDDGVRPVKFIRDLCVFAHHDLLSQPPFVNLDLVSCRNVLIYFQADVQAEILAKFHHALRPNSWLLLGQSESAGGQDHLYRSDDKHVKLFSRRDAPSPRLHDLRGQGRLIAPMAGLLRPPTQASTMHETSFHQHLLQWHAPPSVMVDNAGRVQHLWGDVSRYLRLEGGRADFSLVGLCLPALRSQVKTLLHLAVASPDAAPISQLVDVWRDELCVPVRLSVQSVRGPGGDVQGLVVGFDEQVAPADRDEVSLDGDPLTWSEELVTAREHLHALTLQLDQANDERQSLYEELQASSEELQSSNEELQASNEELTTLNEQLLSKSEELTTLNDVLLSIERSMQTAMVVVDQEMRVMRFNPLAVRIFGLLDHDVGRPLHSVPCSLPLGDLAQRVRDVLLNGGAQVTRVDQGDRHYVMQLSPLHDARAQLAGVILTFTDVAELRVAEAERSRLAAIVTSSDDAIVGKTLSGIITSWNPGAERLFGYPAEEAIGQPMLMVFPPEEQAQEAMLLARVARGETVSAFDTVRLRRDGTRVAVSVALSPIRDGSGQIVGVSKIARDISQRKALEAQRQADQARLEELVGQRTQALAEKERHLQSILDGVPGMVAYWDRELCLRFANQLHRRILKHNGPDHQDVRMAELLGPAAFEHARPHVEAVLRGEPCVFEGGDQAPDENGLVKRFQIYFSPDSANDEIKGFIVMAFDVTLIKRAEAAAEAASQAKSEFLANMSHEIRTPLNAVLGLAQLAQRQHADQPVADTFAYIVQAGQHLLGVINDVLDFSKIEAGKLDLQIGRVEMRELIDQSVGMVADVARDKGLQVRISCDPGLAQAYAGDPTRLAQLLINLLTNAVKFTEVGRVELLVRAHEDGVSIIVSDTGPGMSPQVMARLFSPFERGDGSTTRRVGGTGLGLSICKRLVDLMQGRILVHSEPDRGSRFEVWLPLKPLLTHTLEVSSPMPLSPLDEPEDAPNGRLTGLRVLVAEDHPINQMVLQQLLEAEGAQMVIVAHGGLAVEQVRTLGPDHFDVVLCDIEMPVMDGYEATSLIRQLAPSLPVIGLTAHAFEDARRRGQAAGMWGYVTKPYMIDTLVNEIRRHVGAMPAGVRPGHRIDPDALVAQYGAMPEFLPRLLAAVHQTCERQPALLSEALSQRQAQSLRQLAHGVAGMAANVLLPDLRALAHRLELAAESDWVAAQALVAEINEALRDVCRQIEQERLKL